MKANKRNIIAAALIVALGTAVYLNWQFGDTSSMFTSATKELGEAEYVNNDVTVTTPDTALSSKQKNYFSTARTEREQTQDKVVNIAKEVLEKTDSSPKSKESAEAQAEKIENYLMYQTNIENLLKAKGFSDSLCCITEEGCTVVVPKSEMEDDSPMIIKDVVFGQTGINYENITITEI